MLSKVTANHPTNCVTFLPAILFVYREVPQSSTDFSPFQLVYRANPRCPLKVCKELLVGKTLSQQNQSNYKTVTHIRNRVSHVIYEIAAEAPEEVKEKHRGYANTNVTHKTLKSDEHLLLLLPDKTDRLAITWQGPFEVLIKISKGDYLNSVRNKE